MNREESPTKVVTVKKCCGCKEMLTQDFFGVDRSRWDGLAPYCRKCHRAKAKSFSARHLERERARQREYRRTHPGVGAAWFQANKKQRLTKAAAWRKANPEKARAYVRAWVAAHPEELAESRRQWKLRNPHKSHEQNAIRRARLRGATTDKVDYETIIERDGLVCHICSAMVTKATLSFDHVVPLARGGAHSMDNIKVAHRRCNYAKGARVAA